MRYDAPAMTFDPLTRRKNPDWIICSDHPTIHELVDYEPFCGMPLHDPESAGSAGAEWDITPRELKEKRTKNPHRRGIDVREPHAWEIVNLEGAELIPLGTLAERVQELDSAEEMVVYCKSGARWARAGGRVRDAGFRKIKKLKGGIVAWAEQVDPELPIYGPGPPTSVSTSHKGRYEWLCGCKLIGCLIAEGCFAPCPSFGSVKKSRRCRWATSSR